VVTREELEADILALRNARTSLLRGSTVKQVERNGRKLVMEMPKLSDLNNAIADLVRQLGELDQAGDPTLRRRRALSVGL